MTDFEERVARELTKAASAGPRFTTALLDKREEGRITPVVSARPRGLLVGLAAAAVAAIVLVGGAGVAMLGSSPSAEHGYAEPGGVGSPAPSSDTDSGAQRRDAEIHVNEVADSLAGFRSMDGFASISVDAASQTVTVHWRGAPPTQLSPRLGRQSNGVVVGVESVPFTHRELTAKAKVLIEQAGRAGIDLQGAGPNAQDSGLVVLATEPTAGDRSHEQVIADLNKIADVPVEVTFADGGVINR
jgi:hypothetical protein